jgi:hypothetical protein
MNTIAHSPHDRLKKKKEKKKGENTREHYMR